MKTRRKRALRSRRSSLSTRKRHCANEKETQELRVHAYGGALLVLAAALVSGAAWGEQPPVPEQPSVAPQIELDGEGVATLEGHSPRLVLPSGARGSASRINVSDSALLVGAAERLFNRSGI